jgi:hypothetical protein
MTQRSFDNHDMGASWQLSPLAIQCINSVNSLKLAVLGMEVRWQVIIEVHIDDHTEKLADTRHWSDAFFV